MSDPGGFAVLLARPEARDPMVLAKALAAVRKTPLQDQIVAAKNGWGIIAENLGEAEAQNLVQQLHQAGVESLALPSSSFVPLPEAKPAATIELLMAAQPVLVAAAGITITSTTTRTVKEGPSAAQKVLSTAILLGTGLPIKIGGRERSVEKTQQHSELIFYLDLLYKDPFRRLRVAAQHFDYSFLKERKLYQIFGNFKLLVGDLAKAAPQAWRNHGTRVLLEGKPMQTMGYGSLTDLERETRWLLTLMKTVGDHGAV
jgi:hypothetical protein